MANLWDGIREAAQSIEKLSEDEMNASDVIMALQETAKEPKALHLTHHPKRFPFLVRCTRPRR